MLPVDKCFMYFFEPGYSKTIEHSLRRTLVQQINMQLFHATSLQQKQNEVIIDMQTTTSYSPVVCGSTAWWHHAA